METYTYKDRTYQVPKYVGVPCCSNVREEDCCVSCKECLFNSTYIATHDDTDVLALHEYIKEVPHIYTCFKCGKTTEIYGGDNTPLPPKCTCDANPELLKG